MGHYDDEIEFEPYEDKGLLVFIDERIEYCEHCMSLREHDSKDYWYWNGRREELRILKNELNRYEFTKK